MKAFGASKRWLESGVTRNELLDTATKLLHNSAASEKLFNFTTLCEAGADSMFNRPCNEYTKN